MIHDKSIKTAVSKRKNNKFTCTDNIPGEFLKYGGKVVQHAVLQLFKRVQLLEALPNDGMKV